MNKRYGAEVCDECLKCKYYVDNDDGLYECKGEKHQCHEFVPIKE